MSAISTNNLEQSYNLSNNQAWGWQKFVHQHDNLLDMQLHYLSKKEFLYTLQAVSNNGLNKQERIDWTAKRMINRVNQASKGAIFELVHPEKIPAFFKDYGKLISWLVFKPSDTQEDAFTTPLHELIKYCPNVNYLFLSSNVVNFDSSVLAKRCKTWGKVSESCMSLGKLVNLCINGLNTTAEESKMFCQFLAVNKTLKNLVIEMSSIGDEGAKVLGQILTVNANLENFTLFLSKVGYEGAEALNGALMVNKTLLSLDLSCNDIGDKGAEAFSKTLKVNRTLTALKLFNTGITAEGIKELTDLCEFNKALKTLNFQSLKTAEPEWSTRMFPNRSQDS